MVTWYYCLFCRSLTNREREKNNCHVNRANNDVRKQQPLRDLFVLFLYSTGIEQNEKKNFHFQFAEMGLFWSNSTQKDDNLETYSLIWLDAEVNNSKENLQAQQQLRTSINHLRTFEDDQQCLAYISTFSKEDRIILIVSGRFGQTVVPKITHLPQIISIYVYCMNREHHEKWAQSFVKVCFEYVDCTDL